MMDRLHFPMQYDHSLVSQARREAEAVSSLETLVKMNQLSEERLHRQKLEMAMKIQQERELLTACRVDPVSMRSHLLGSSALQRGSMFAQQHRPEARSILPPNSLIPETLVGRAREEFLSSLPSNRASNPLENLFLQRARVMPDKTRSFTAVSKNDSKLSEIRDLVASAAAGVEAKESSLKSSASTEKVKAALRSRPQRGRKRMNLSKEERVELTKTRNREHARNTRIRKKARYTELLKSEKQLESFEKMHQLESERLECLEQFLSTRQNMINEPGASDDTISDKFTDLIVASMKDFDFETKGLPSVFDCKDKSPTSQMSHWDKQLRSKVFGSNKISSSTFFAYELEDGLDGVAISKNGSCYTPVDVMLYQVYKDDEQERSSTPPLTKETVTDKNGMGMHKFVLLKVLLKVQFGVDESAAKLASVAWTVLEDRCGLES